MPITILLAWVQDCHDGPALQKRQYPSARTLVGWAGRVGPESTNPVVLRPLIRESPLDVVGKAPNAVRRIPQFPGLDRPVQGELEDHRRLQPDDPRLPSAMLEMHCNNCD